MSVKTGDFVVEIPDTEEDRRCLLQVGEPTRFSYSQKCREDSKKYWVYCACGYDTYIEVVDECSNNLEDVNCEYCKQTWEYIEAKIDAQFSST